MRAQLVLGGSGVGELGAQARVVLLGGGQPDAVVGGGRGLVAEDDDDLLAHVHRGAAEHRPRDRADGLERVEHELVRHPLLRRGREEHLVGGRARAFRAGFLDMGGILSCDTGRVDPSVGDAFRFDATRLPVLVVEVLRGHSDDEHRAYLETVERYVRESDLLVVVYHVRTTALPSARQRRAQGEWITRNRALLHQRTASVFVFPNPAIRFVFSLILLASPIRNPYKVVETREQAFAWAREFLRHRRRTWSAASP
jgi:hypothetical protein